MTLSLLIQTAVAFIGTSTFSLIFNIPAREILFCGVVGAAGWLVSGIIQIQLPDGAVLGTFAGTLTLTGISRALSFARKKPVLVYLIGGILPLLPGAGLYHTMYDLIITNDTYTALESGIRTAQLTGAIALAIICVLSLPPALFGLRKR